MAGQRTLGWLATSVAFLTVIWVVLLIAHQVATPAPELSGAGLAALAAPEALTYATYTNACVLTVATTMLFGGLYLICREANPLRAMFGLVCVPMYGLANLVAYGSQLFLVPALARAIEASSGADLADVVLPLVVQDWPGSAMQALNLGAYALLGIPSLLYGVLLSRTTPHLRLAGVGLAISGVLSWVAFAGLLAGSQTLAALTLVSGVTFLVGLIGLAAGLLRGAPHREPAPPD